MHQILAKAIVASSLLIIFAPPCHGQKTEHRIDPAGIHGTLMLCGHGEAPEATINAFKEMAHGKNARIVVIDLGKTKRSADWLLRHRLRGKYATNPNVKELRIGSDEDANETGFADELKTATAVWLTAAKLAEAKSLLNGTVIGKQLREFAKRKGVIAARGPAADALVDTVFTVTRGKITVSRGLRHLPDSLLHLTWGEKHRKPDEFARTLKSNSRLVGYEIDPQSALIIRGRRLIPTGKGQVRIHLAASKKRPAKTIVLDPSKPRQYADLTALRRAARVRVKGVFPPKKPEAPFVKKGTLIIIGGGGMPKGLLKRFVDLAGGKKASIVTFPTASPGPLPRRSGFAAALRRAGAGEVTYLPHRKLKDVESKEFLDTLQKATGIWFGGGRQWRFVDAYENTKAHKLMFDVLKRGGVIAGSSAGASIQAEYMARGNPLGNLDIMAEGYEQGLGFIKGVAVDQHFARRNRFKDMTSLVKTYPQFLGIGIDEATAIIVKGQTADVVGRGKVYFYDAHRKVEKGQPDYVAVAAGGRYDLRERAVVGSAKQKTRRNYE